MLENLTQQPPDKIIMLSGMFRADERTDKIDLGVGVYKDANGNTPIMRAVKKAEQLLWNEETTKSYTALVGDGAFHKVMADLVLGDSVSRDRLAFAHAPGGTGAIRQILELIKVASPDATIWMSNPTWPNHPAMVKGVGIPMQTYTYLDMETRTVDFDGMMGDLANVKSGDVVILHGCCHNPTGANLNQTQWGDVADLLIAKGAVPFVDIAYQGFGDGLQEDAFGVRLLAQKCPDNHRSQLFQELWYLPRTLWSGDHRVQRREQYGVGARYVVEPEPFELLLSARSRCASCDHGSYGS